MSAYIVSNAHIDALITFGLQDRHGGHELRWFHEGDGPDPWHTLELGNASEVGRMLLLENHRSVAYRYSEPVELVTYEYVRAGWAVGRIDPVKILGALYCFEYQSCECDDWKQSEAFAFCDALRHRAIHKLPGYDAGPWDVHGPADVLVKGDRSISLMELVTDR